jgi:hypothetical protein
MFVLPLTKTSLISPLRSAVWAAGFFFAQGCFVETELF